MVCWRNYIENKYIYHELLFLFFIDGLCKWDAMELQKTSVWFRMQTGLQLNVLQLFKGNIFFQPCNCHILSQWKMKICAIKKKVHLASIKWLVHSLLFYTHRKRLKSFEQKKYNKTARADASSSCWTSLQKKNFEMCIFLWIKNKLRTTIQNKTKKTVALPRASCIWSEPSRNRHHAIEELRK